MKGYAALIAAGLVLLCPGTVRALPAGKAQNYSLVERTDLRRYDNGKYVGLMSREVRSFIVNAGTDADGGTSFEGDFYVVEKTLRNTRSVARGLQTAIPSAFRLGTDGSCTMTEDHGFPSFRSFPSYPAGIAACKAGDTWQAEAERAVDPLNRGVPTRLPVLAEYTYVRRGTYRGEDVHVITARWATRYVAGQDPDGDDTLRSASGTHSATIYAGVRTGSALLIQDKVDEAFSYADGTTVAFKGTISLFTEYPAAVNHAEVTAAVKKERALDEFVETEETPAGLRLTIGNLQFKPDSAELLATEDGRLDGIAAVLLRQKDSSFLIEGHTASTGNSAGEMKLSLERAQAIAAALIARGVPAEKCICKGSGGTKPVADNTSEQGRMKNRRVEITILE